MSININSRQSELSHLENYLKEIDTEITMILQNFQWDRKHLEEKTTMLICQYDANHRVPPDKLLDHEKNCFLKSLGYTNRDCLLPSPVDPNARTLVKLSAADIEQIISNASDCEPLVNTGPVGGAQPLSLARLQAAYSPAQRRALHAAVAARAPAPRCAADPPLLSKLEGGAGPRARSRAELEAALRDQRRRRARYRVPAARNHSAALRDVIAAQMELLTQANDNATQDIPSAMQDMYVKNSDSNSYHKSPGDNKPKAESTAIDRDATSRRYHSKEKQSLNLGSGGYGDSRINSKHHERYENRKRRHDDSYTHTSDSKKYYKTKDSHDIGFDTTSEYAHNSNDGKLKRSKEERKTNEREDDTRSKKDKYKGYEDNDNQRPQREKGRDYTKKDRNDDYIVEASINTRKYTRDTNSDVSFKEKHYSSKRHRSYGEKEDRNQYRQRKFSSKSSSDRRGRDV